MPVVKMGSGAQTQAKHCRGRREGYRFGCQVQFTFLSAFVNEEGKEKVKLVATVYLLLFFLVLFRWCFGRDVVSEPEENTVHDVVTGNRCTNIFKSSYHITK